MRPTLLISALVCLLASEAGAADEVSSGDKLRMLYSNQFAINDDGVPLVTIEVMSGQTSVSLTGEGGMRVLPDGEGGAEVTVGRDWTVTGRAGKSAQLREWTVVEKLHPDAETEISAAVSRWKSRGYPAKTFEIGTLFAISGEVMDTRRTLIAVAPTALGKGGPTRKLLAEKYGVFTESYTEVVKLPRGTIVGESGEVQVSNPSVLWFAAKKPGGTITVRNVITGDGGSQLTTSREDRRYFGSVFVTVGKDGKLVVVNSVSADRLLAGLVPSEIFPSAPEAALRAQAVAARTELLEKLGKRHFGDPFLLCSSQKCQVYSGAGKEHPRTTAAVRDTRGLILKSRSGELVDARYSASCGGHSENKENIWGGEADLHLTGVVDAVPGSDAARRFAAGITEKNLDAFFSAPIEQFYEGRTPYAKGRLRWNKSISTDELTRRVSEHYPRVGQITGLVPLARGRSGRINKIRIVGSTGQAVAEGDLHIRRMFGGLRSTLFKVSTRGPKGTPTAFFFEGAGFGHGVGMCQIGAIGMAAYKKTFREILGHYYNGAEVRRLY